MVIPDGRAGIVRKIDQHVVRPDVDFPIGDVLRMNEQDLVDPLLHRNDHGTGQAVQITTSHQAHGGFLRPPGMDAQGGARPRSGIGDLAATILGRNPQWAAIRSGVPTLLRLP